MEPEARVICHHPGSWPRPLPKPFLRRTSLGDPGADSRGREKVEKSKANKTKKRTKKKINSADFICPLIFDFPSVPSIICPWVSKDESKAETRLSAPPKKLAAFT